MIWAAPYWLLGLGLVFVGLIWDWRKGNGQEKEGGRWPQIKQLWASREGWLNSNTKKGSKRLFWWLGLGLVIVALARPQWGRVEQVVFDRSRDVLIALDLSRSMLAEDVKPSRLERGKLLLSSLLTDLKGERVGLLVFSGTAFLQSPLSTDYEILQEFMPELTPQLLPQGGTDYGRMLKVALEAFSDEAGADRFLIVLSDGESRTESWRDSVKSLKEKKIRVIGLGIGTREGSVIPDSGGGWLKNKEGAVVLSKLGDKTLQELARETGGLYREASGWVDLKSLIEETVNAGKLAEVTEKREERRAERFQIFLALAVVCGLISLWREFPVKPRSHDFSSQESESWWRGLFHRMGILFLLGTLFLNGNEAKGQVGQMPVSEPANVSTNQEMVQLPKVIHELSEKKRLNAKDYATMAEETIRYGKEVLAKGGSSTLEPVVKDALEGVNAGEVLDRKAADWERLRRELEELLKKQQQQQEQKKQQEDQKKQESPEEKEKQQQQNQDSSSQDKDSNSSSDKESSDSKKPEKDQSGKQEKPGENGKENNPEKKQKVGGKQQQKETPASMAEAGAQQKLDQVKQKDSPARLFQLMEGGIQTNAVSGEEEEW